MATRGSGRLVHSLDGRPAFFVELDLDAHRALETPFVQDVEYSLEVDIPRAGGREVPDAFSADLVLEVDLCRSRIANCRSSYGQASP